MADCLQLARRVAELQHLSRDHVLLSRGQGHDHRNVRNSTTLTPSLFRPSAGRRDNPAGGVLDARFRRLRRAEQILVRRYAEADFPGQERLARQRILRWSLLQHYEICRTPLLDVTHSLRVAASFAAERTAEETFVYVLAAPNLSGAITASAEAGLQVVRLASVCPPVAVRPHLQEGYLLGEYPELGELDQKELYPHFEIDFGRRLVAKFRLRPEPFWDASPGFPPVPHAALYPSEADDPMAAWAAEVKAELGRG